MGPPDQRRPPGQIAGHRLDPIPVGPLWLLPRWCTHPARLCPAVTHRSKGRSPSCQSGRGMNAAADPPPGPATGQHPTSGIDERVHQRHRLGILTITAEAQRAEFGYLRDALGLTAGNLSRPLTVLEEAGMIQVEKYYAGRSGRRTRRPCRTPARPGLDQSH